MSYPKYILVLQALPEVRGFFQMILEIFLKNMFLDPKFG